jgi:adenylate cyclase
MPIWRLYYFGGGLVVEERAKRKLTAILSADVKGYSRLMGQDELSTVETLKRYREIISSLVQQYSGRVVDSPGDNILAEFSSVVDAVECAVKIQGDLQEKNAGLPENRRMQFRIGVNLGDVIDDEGRIYGDGVNVAARVEGLAEGGGICISRKTFNEVKNKLSLGYEYLGEHSVKNITEPVRVYKVLMEPEHAGKVVGDQRPKPKQWRWAALAIGFIIVVGALAIWNFYFRPPPIEPASVEKMAYPLPEKPSIAVLPFDNLSGDPEQEYFSDGITEEIITALSKTPKLFVIARNSTFTYKGKPVKVQQVGRELGVKYVLEGSVRKAGGKVRITAQLADAQTGHHLWADRYDRDLKDIFAIQDEITMKIITALQVKLTEGEQARILGKGTDNLEAYVKFLQSREHFFRMNKQGSMRARQLAKEAISLDPEYAGPYTILALTHMMDLWFKFTESPKESMKMALEAAQKALTLDDSDPGTHVGLCMLYIMQRQHDKAIAAGERAVLLSPSGASSHSSLGTALMFAGRPNEAIPFIKKAINLNPFPPSIYLRNLGSAYRMAGRNEEAIVEYKKSLPKNPDDLFTHLGLAVAYVSLGREEEARAEAAQVLRIYPKFSLEYYAKTLPLRNQADADYAISSLRKAGLK